MPAMSRRDCFAEQLRAAIVSVAGKSWTVLWWYVALWGLWRIARVLT
jgi:hypothetical protein